MRNISSRVTFLNRFRNITTKKILIRNEFSGLSTYNPLEKTLANLLGIKAGTLFAVEHETSYGVRVILEKFIAMGFVVQYGEGPLVCDYPKFNHASVVFRNEESETQEFQMSWGFTFLDSSPEVSLYKALFESVERHATYYIEASKTREYPRIYKGDASFLYPLVPHFRKEQVDSLPLLAQKEDDLRKVYGFKVRSLLSNKKTFLPLSCFYFGMDLFKESHSLLFEPTTSGSGAGTTKEMATLAGMYEALERDHFHLYWLADIHPRRIVFDETSSFTERVQKIQDRYNLEIYFFDMRYDFDVKACYVLIIDPILHIVSCGAKVGQNSQSVVEGALLEAVAVLDSIREVGKMKNKEEMEVLLQGETYLNKNITKLERIRMYCSLEGIAMLRRRLSLDDSEVISFEQFSLGSYLFKNQKDELAFMLSEFKRMKKVKGEGYDLYCHYHTSLYTKELDCYVAHVFVPSLIKLYLTETFAAPVSQRLFDFAKEKGKISFSEQDINTLPHFFP